MISVCHFEDPCIFKCPPDSPVGGGSGNLQPLKTQENSDSSLFQLNQDPVSVLLCRFIKVTNSLDEGGDGFDLFLQLKAVQPAF